MAVWKTVWKMFKTSVPARLFPVSAAQGKFFRPVPGA